MELTPEVRKRIKAMMDKNNDTGYTLNKKLGISATTIGNYINEDSRIQKADNTKLRAMCELWGISMEWLETGQTLIKQADETVPTEEFPEGSLEYTINQIFLQLNSKSEQFTNLRKDLSFIRNELGEMKKEITNLKKEVNTLKPEIQKLKDN